MLSEDSLSKRGERAEVRSTTQRTPARLCVRWHPLQRPQNLRAGYQNSSCPLSHQSRQQDTQTLRYPGATCHGSSAGSTTTRRRQSVQVGVLHCSQRTTSTAALMSSVSSQLLQISVTAGLLTVVLFLVGGERVLPGLVGSDHCMTDRWFQGPSKDLPRLEAQRLFTKRRLSLPQPKVYGL